MAYKDLREFLTKLEERKLLYRVNSEVDWNEEIGTLAQEVGVRGGPALLFENIKGHKDTAGRKLVIDVPGSLQRLSLALNLPENSHPRDIIPIFRKRIKRPIKPILVSKGPCKEVVKKGDELNLLEFPVPKLHAKDGGRYIMTYCMVISKDPDTGWVNAGTYRGMIHDRNSIGILYHPTQHQGVHGRKYEAMGKPMPMAVVIGVEPALFIPSCTPFPVGVDEYNMMGALREEPIEVVPCETIDLPVPANAEIILEGEMSLDPSTFKPEGPFGEYPGHYSTIWSEPAPVYKVNCVTHRKDPILESTTLGVGPHLAPTGTDFLGAVGFSSLVWDHLEAHGVQGITGVWMDPHSLATNVFISINKLYYGHAKQVAAALWGSPISFEIGKFVIVVDSDVDIFDLSKINAAIANRVQGAKDVVVYPWNFGGPLDPGNSPEVKRLTGGIGNWDRVLIDATWPFEWEPREEWGGLKHPPKCLAEEEMLHKIRKRWKEYGLEGIC